MKTQRRTARKAAPSKRTTNEDILTSGHQSTKIELELGDSLFSSWQKIRAEEGLTTDAQTVRFLIQQYQGRQNKACYCVRCQTPIALLCTKCNNSLKKETDGKAFNVQGTPQAVVGDDSDEGALHTFDSERGGFTGNSLNISCVQSLGLEVSKAQSLANRDPFVKAQAVSDACSEQVRHPSSHSAESAEEPCFTGDVDADRSGIQAAAAVIPTVSDTVFTSSVGPFKCSTCQAVLASKYSLQRHLETHQGVKSYKCSECGRSFNRKNNFTAHLKHTHKLNDIFPCSVCDASFGTYKLMRLHMVTHGEKPFTCEVCQKSFAMPSQLKLHSLKHTGEKPHKCTVCTASFRVISCLKDHMNVHTGEKPYICKECGASFAHAGNLREHKLTHSEEKRYACEICNKRFGHPGSLRKHVRGHKGLRPYMCTRCGKCFMTSHHLKNHMNTHSGTKSVICSVCGVGLSCHTVLKQHMRRHTGEKPFKCQQCGLAFISNNFLKNHMRVHSDHPQHTCSVCGQPFSQSTQLKQHMRLHRGDKAITCQECDKVFFNSFSLKRHMTIHTGKPFTCSICGTGFCEKATLRRHTKRKHSKDQQEVLPSKDEI